MDRVYSRAWNEVYLQIIRVFLNSIPKLHPPKFYGQNWNFRSGKENKDIIVRCEDDDIRVILSDDLGILKATIEWEGDYRNRIFYTHIKRWYK